MTTDKAKEILKDLSIDKNGNLKDNKYVIELTDSEEYAYYYSLLDHEENLILSDSSSVSSEYITSVSYDGYDFSVSLNANFNDNYYNIVIEDQE